MLREIVKISAIEPEFIRLLPFNNGTCTSCSLKPSCGQYLLNSFYMSRELELPSKLVPKEMNIKTLKNGTQVQINIEARQLVQFALLLYLLPLLNILLVALLAELAGFSEMLILALVVIVLFFSMSMIHRYLKSHVGLEEINLSLIPES